MAPQAIKQQILVVDDELDSRIFTSVLLKKFGYEPIQAKNGREGIALARKHPPDLIILDVMMPEEGGAHTYRELRTDEALQSIPIFMVSAVAPKTFYHYLSMLNAKLPDPIPLPNAYFEKPLDSEELIKRVKAIIG